MNKSVNFTKWDFIKIHSININNITQFHEILTDSEQQRPFGGNSSTDTSLIRDIYCGPEVCWDFCRHEIRGWWWWWWWFENIIDELAIVHESICLVKLVKIICCCNIFYIYHVLVNEDDYLRWRDINKICENLAWEPASDADRGVSVPGKTSTTVYRCVHVLSRQQIKGMIKTKHATWRSQAHLWRPWSCPFIRCRHAQVFLVWCLGYKTTWYCGCLWTGNKPPAPPPPRAFFLISDTRKLNKIKYANIYPWAFIPGMNSVS